MSYLRSRGKAIVVTFSDDEVSDHKSKSDQEGNFMAFTTTVVVSQSEIVEKNPSDGELSENDNLHEAYNKLCKIAAKDTYRHRILYPLQREPLFLDNA